jgi:hypothetical protein
MIDISDHHKIQSGKCSLSPGDLSRRQIEVLVSELPASIPDGMIS